MARTRSGRNTAGRGRRPAGRGGRTGRGLAARGGVGDVVDRRTSRNETPYLP